jgi:hypothetical protein
MMQCSLRTSLVLFVLLLSPLGCNRRQVADAGASPKAAVAGMMRAVNERDGVALKQIFASGADRAYVEALTRVLVAGSELQGAAVSAGFDQDSSRTLLPHAGPSSADFAKFADAREQVAADGNSATLTAADGVCIKLIKESGQWRVLDDGVAVAETPATGPTTAPAGAGATDKAHATRLLTQVADVMTSLAKDLRGGRFKGQDIKDVRAAVNAAVQAAVVQSLDAQ